MMAHNKTKSDTLPFNPINVSQFQRNATIHKLGFVLQCNIWRNKSKVSFLSVLVFKKIGVNQRLLLVNRLRQ